MIPHPPKRGHDNSVIQTWVEAFTKAQSEFPPIPKTRTANLPQYSYKYADLGDVLAACLPILHKHHLALSQSAVTDGDRVGVTTRIYHVNGHVEEFGPLYLTAGNSSQSAGSSVTYARRYSACAALGVVADEDDDGAAVSSSKVGGSSQADRSRSQPSSPAQGVSPRCPNSGHHLWDNRDENVRRVAEGKKAMPAFKCVDRDCGWITWDEHHFDPQPVREDFEEAPPLEYPPGEEPFE